MKPLILQDVEQYAIDHPTCKEVSISMRTRRNPSLGVHNFSSYVVLNDINLDKLKTNFNSISKSDILGVFETEEEAKEYQKKFMFNDAIEYIPHVDLSCNPTRSFIVYINDHNIVNHGFYNVFLADYKNLQKYMQLRLATVDDIPHITYPDQESRVIFVHNLAPYKNIELYSTILVKYDSQLELRDIPPANELIYSKINTYRHIENKCFKTAVKELKASSRASKGSELKDDSENSKTMEEIKSLKEDLKVMCKSVGLNVEYANHLITRTKEEADESTIPYLKFHLPLVLMKNRKPIELEYIDVGHTFHEGEISLKQRVSI